MADAPPPDRADDAGRSDRRTMLIAAIVMLALVLVGVGSAAIFARSACDALVPSALDVGSPASLDEQTEPAIQWLTEQVGALAGVVDVPGADTLTVTPAGVVALGDTASLLSPDGSAVAARIGLGEGSVVGSGGTLYSLALTNELTGQVDALLPLDTGEDGELAPLTCVDTALVGTPLAFHLAADDGELLLLRVEDDGEDPEVELRDPVAGSVWSQSLESALAPPGVLGERTTGALSADLAVVGRRTAPDDGSPVVTAFEREGGAVRWALDRDGLVEAVDARHAQRVEVFDAADVVLVGFTDEPETDDDTTGPATLVALDPAAGTVLWSVSAEAGEVVRAAAAQGRGGWVVLEGPQDALRILEVDAAGAPAGSVEVSGGHGGLAVDGDEVLLAHDGGFVRGTASELSASSIDTVSGLDVVVHEGGVTVLVSTAEGREQALTFVP